MTSFAKFGEIKAGDHVCTDAGFTCMPSGIVKRVYADKAGQLYIRCKQGHHDLAGQLTDGRYIGLYKASLHRSITNS